MAERMERHESAGEWPTPAVSELLAERVRASPGAVFLVDGAERLTFAEFGRRVGAVAAGLRRLGVGACGHGNLCRPAGSAAGARASPAEVSRLLFPLTHIGGIGSFLMLPILLGSRVVYLDVWEPERALALIESEGSTAAGGPPALLQGLLASPGFRPERVRSVRIASTGAADIPPELVREVQRRLAPVSYRSYGLTECPMLTAGTVDDREEDCACTDGRPTPGCTVRVVDDAGTPLPAGSEG
jgi:acyl-CoA synthetase (AMP-forming)/AMP-acid ligase II